jgi:hypothetical protein
MTFFLPFYWLPLAPFIQKPPKKAVLYIALSAALLVTFRYIYFDRLFVQNSSDIASKIFYNTEYLTNLTSLSSRNNIAVYSDDNNLYFDLKYLVLNNNVIYLCPGKNDKHVDQIVLFKNTSTPGISGLENKDYFHLGDYYASGRRSYALLYER